MHNLLDIELQGHDDTVELGRLVGSLLRCGQVVTLIGDLGAGKTTFVKGLSRGAGVYDLSEVCSPSYTLLNEYLGKIPLYHFDFYRLEEPSEIMSLGYEEYFEGEGISVVEWADKCPMALPPEHIEISLQILEPHGRRARIVAKGEQYSPIIDCLRKRGLK